MKVARTVSELERKPRAVAIGTFDGVHTGHRRVLRAAVDAGLDSTVVLGLSSAEDVSRGVEAMLGRLRGMAVQQVRA